MTPLERAARALYQRLGTEIADPENGGEDERWPEFVDDARAVLQAIREPSEAMLPDPHDTSTPIYQAARLIDDDAASSADVFRSAWQAMIDAAMEEG